MAIRHARSDDQGVAKDRRPGTGKVLRHGDVVLPDVFEWTWGPQTPATSTGRVQSRVRRRPFLLHGRGLLGHEWDIAAAGFDHTYDKRLYEPRRSAPARAEHFALISTIRTGWLDSSENHADNCGGGVSVRHAPAAAAILRRGCGSRHQGWLEGRGSGYLLTWAAGRSRPSDPCFRSSIGAEYILRRASSHTLAIGRTGAGRDGNWTDCFVAFALEHEGERLLVVGKIAAPN